VHYAAIRRPLDPKAFIADLKKRMTAGLDGLPAALAGGSAGGVKVTTRKGEPWIAVPKLEPPAEPTGLQALKEEVGCRERGGDRGPAGSPAQADGVAGGAGPAGRRARPRQATFAWPVTRRARRVVQGLRP
jgi:hypothetical protein